MKYRVLNKNRDFTRIYARGKSYVHPHLVLYVAKNRLGHPRIGLTATKKVGGAVQRNRARRVMRAALAEHLSPNCGGYDIILVARARTPHLKSTQVARTLARLMKKAGLPLRPHAGGELPARAAAQAAAEPPAAVAASGVPAGGEQP